ncbi:hypothetical protein Bbelb_083490 [Branchiostoma belcheri]|nr:hypothetical protein Bbelb_083490 [Branchiostoma belcheri]
MDILASPEYGNRAIRDSSRVHVTPEQVQKIVNAFNSGTLAEFYTSGLFIGDEADNKYKFLRQNESSIYVKKGEAGACVYLTKSCIIFGVYSEGMQGGNCNNVVEKLGDYLRGSGY